jgi:phospholipid-binding lipoprotein MlaA
MKIQKALALIARTIVLFVILLAGGTASYADQVKSEDQLQGFNRFMYTFNDKIDIIILKPIATLYNKIMPKPLNKGVHNVYINIGNLPTIANDILQLHFYQMTNDFWRLAINTTVGIGGLFDVAGRIGLEPYTNDFGLTLARYGFRNSIYLVLPFFGPSTLRDTIGMPVDYYVSIYPYIYPRSTRYGIYGLGVVDRRAQLLQFEPIMEEAALDKYIFIRNAYLQRRTFLIEQNRNFGVITQHVEQKAKSVPDMH